MAELAERIARAIPEDGGAEPLHGVSKPSFCVIALDADLLDATVRLVRLLDSPAEARVLRPLITREIVYRLLMGEQGNRLRHVALLGGQTDRIAEAVERLRREFNQLPGGLRRRLAVQPGV